MNGAAPWISVRAARTPDAVALRLASETVRYRELHARARTRAAAFLDLGLRPGDVAALLLTGGAFAEVLHAASLCGITLLPLNLRLTPREIAFQLRDSRARWVLHGDAHLADLAKAAVRDISGATRIPIDSQGGSAGHRAAPTGPGHERTVDPDAPLAILYTSGTTGRPKGAILTHGNFLASARASGRLLGVDASDRFLACMPLFHVGGLSILLRAVLAGASVTIHERFDAEAVARALDSHRGEGITHVSLVASMLKRVLDAHGEKPAAPQLRCVLLGGGPTPEPLLERARRLGFPVAPTYGLTEATSQVATRPPEDAARPLHRRLRPLPGVEVRTLEPSGEPVSAGEPGEICVRGSIVMKGYSNLPEESARALRGGWLHTGDMGCLERDGTLRVLDRRSDLIVSGGENVYPAEVEAVLLEHPAVTAVGVAGRPDPELGERPVAWWVPESAEAPPDPVEAGELRAFCRERLAPYKIPVDFVRVETLPRNASGKLVRAELKARPD